MTYYRLKYSDTWHWHKRCSHLKRMRKAALVKSKTRPRGDLCNECKAKERRDAR